MKWYRVEYGARGALVSIEECPKAGPNAMLVIYVQAEDADGARHAAYLERQKMQQRSRHAAYEEQGLCRCGREKPASAKRCDSCLERNRKYNRRKADRAAGRPPRDELAPKKEAFAARRQELEQAAVQKATAKLSAELAATKQKLVATQRELDVLRAASTGRLGIDRVEPRSAKRILVSIDGEVKSLRTWCTELGINYGTVHARVRRGWDPNEAIGASLRCKEVA